MIASAFAYLRRAAYSTTMVAMAAIQSDLHPERAAWLTAYMIVCYLGLAVMVWIDTRAAK